MKVIDEIQGMDIDKLTKFLTDNFAVGNAAMKWFEKNYCSKCEMHEGTTEETGTKIIKFYECDTPEGCPHGTDIIKIWLESEAE